MQAVIKVKSNSSDHKDVEHALRNFNWEKVKKEIQDQLPEGFEVSILQGWKWD